MKKEELQNSDGVIRQRSVAGQVKVVLVLKPIRGKSSNLRTSHKTAANDPARPDTEGVAVSRTHSTSTSSLGSEGTEKRPPDKPTKAAKEVTGKHGTRVEPKHPSEAAGEECVDDQRGGTGEPLLTEACVEKPRNPIRVSTLSVCVICLRLVCSVNSADMLQLCPFAFKSGNRFG